MKCEIPHVVVHANYANLAAGTYQLPRLQGAVMSSSLSTAIATPAATLNNPSVTTQATTTTPATASGLRNAPAAATAAAAAGTSIGAITAQFREIHKNTWLKRLSADGKKYTVGPKKSECSWVVFCVHDDTEALLEGYAEPRQAPAHIPEWIVSLRDTLHISHALIPNSHEFEFVVTLSNEVLRFHAVSWEIMQEWVETLRSKLREMKILSPRENLYTKLPEVRAPLLPTRDPTSPLPAPPPVPAAIVPGVERVVVAMHQNPNNHEQTSRTSSTAESTTNTTTSNHSSNSSVSSSITTTTSAIAATVASAPTTMPHPAAMSNTLTQNLLNMLSDPISTYSEQINEATETTTFIENGSSVDTQHSTNDSDQNLSDDEFLSPLLRKACVADNDKADQMLNLEQICERLIPRPQTSRSLSAGAADKTKRTRKIPQTSAASEVSNFAPTTSHIKAAAATSPTTAATAGDPQDNVTIIQVSSDLLKNELPPKLPPKTNNNSADIFRFPDIQCKVKGKPKQQQQRSQQQQQQQVEYKSNVQIIPSNSNTIQVVSAASATNNSSGGNPYTMPVKPNASNATPVTSTQSSSNVPHTNTTMVQVLGESPQMASTTTVAVYGTCYPTPAATSNGTSLTPKLSKKIILNASNTSGVTSISVNNEQAGDAVISGNVHYEKVFLSSSIPLSGAGSSQQQSPRRLTRAPSIEERPAHAIVTVESSSKKASLPNGRSPAMPRRRLASPPTVPSSSSTRSTPQLTRGLTELVISTRPSRRDFHYLKLLNTPLKTKPTIQKTTSAANNNIESLAGTSSSSSTTATPAPAAVSRGNASNSILADTMEQRRRSSSTSDAQAPLQRVGAQRGANNNEFTPVRAFRMQQPPQPTPVPVNNIGAVSPSKRLTLREQQVMQLRREIMHPGGVRLNLRRKDCVGSIAWVEAFGGVWIAGWKQKEHPVLYNALHIGDQLLSIAGVSITNAAEANKIIRNTNTLFVEVLLRRMPFGRAYAIRRDREGQCLGLIRDGNTSTIVDIVPNSLAARHGLPPKAKSCDGSALTFWILTEINGRPLNLFFKELEIRDRLNSVGRDISILVQPSDLITKLKKQLKSLRGYKDYLVQ
ncbi:mucin-5AC [Scaptodrosophila lebanonensis]|uniref:Mucin-5AC n=1 Tax=Drosophila lebanonensis TaxID=7225 RepID=A0A6J2T2P5_DROLE|nr:mucin-5AC [Scaptodrosophila lebanonensis]